MTVWQRWKQTSLSNKLLIVVGASATVLTFGQLLILKESAAQATAERIDNFRPVLVFEVVEPYRLASRNIGKGPGLDIELRLSQVHRLDFAIPPFHNQSLSFK
jgi:hypothetical protein